MRFFNKYRLPTPDKSRERHNNIFTVLISVARGVLGGKVILGDSAYPILPWLMPPYPNPDTPAQER